MKSGHSGSALLILAFLAGCDKPEPPPAPPRPALVMVVKEEADSGSMVLVGEVRPRYESVQGFRIDGKIIERKAEVGMPVKKGQLLAKLDPADTLLSSSAAQADVKSAEASLALARAEVARYRNLASKNFVSKSALDIKETEFNNASARLTEIRARADVSANQAKYTHLAADRDGVITMIRAEPGQVVEAGDPVTQIADTKHFDVLVAVPESRVLEAKLNTKVAIKLWANDSVIYPGIVREIAPSADINTRTFNVRITVTQQDAGLKWGMTAKVKFNPQNAAQHTPVLIPSTALTDINGKKTVWVIDSNNKAQPRTVTPGPFSEHGVFIFSGIRSGEKIAIAGVHTLIKDQQVTPIVEAMP